AGCAPGRSITWRSADRISPTRSKATEAFEKVSDVFERSLIGLYILPRYRTKTTSAPAAIRPDNTQKTPQKSTRQVPAATTRSTSGASFALTLRARSVASTLARL